jgi:hypothetical protein
MSSLNWELSYRYGFLQNPELLTEKENPSLYELWGLSSSERKWYHDPLARVEKRGKKWELTTYKTQGFQQTQGTYKTLKEAQAMGIAIVAMEGIKHGD